MKNKLETELTYFTGDVNVDTKAIIEELSNKINGKQLNVFRYNDRIQLLLEDDRHDKTKITFKVNHGNLYFSLATKDRLSSTEDTLQMYHENKTEWTPIDEIDLRLFDRCILSLYYKEMNKLSVDHRGEKYQIIGHDVKFVDLNCQVKNEIKYVEIESKNFVQEDIDLYDDFFRNRSYESIDYENSKLKVGRDILGANNKLSFAHAADLKQFIMNFYTEMSICNFV